MDDKLQEIEEKFERLTAHLGDPGVLSDPVRYRQMAKDRAQLEPLVDAFRDFKRVRAEVQGNEALLADPDADVRQMARDELPALKAELARLEDKLKLLLVPRDPNDERDVIL